MPDLAKYIRTYHQKGYSISSLRTFLKQQGYSDSDIEAGINSAYSPENHNKLWIIGGSIIGVIVLIVLFLIFLIPSTPDLTLSSSIIQDVSQGERASFKFVVSGTQDSYDATLSYSVTMNGVVVDSSSKVVDVSQETFLYTFTPSESGKYVVTSSLDFDGNKKTSSFEFFVESSCGNNVCENFETSDSCSQDCPVIICGDGICSNDEVCEQDCNIKQTICGDGICDAKEICSADCDTCGNGVCDSNENFLSCEQDCSVPVCGDGTCETGETCSADCSVKTGINKFSRYELINYVAEQSTTSTAEKVAKDCDTLTDIESKDLCYSELVKNFDEAFYCKFISVFTKKDDCYITYAYENGDFTVCSSLEDRFKRQTCEGLEQQRELQKKYS